MFGGKNCSGKYSEESECNLNLCFLDGKYVEWNEWIECFKICESGI